MQNKVKSFITNDNGRIMIYYAALTVVYTMWARESAPPSILRMGFLAAVVFPLFYKHPQYTPFVVVLFDSLVRYGFAYSFMPFEMYWYYAITACGVIFSIAYIPSNRRYKIPPLILFLALYFLMVDLLTSGSVSNNAKTIFMVSLFFPCFINKDRELVDNFGMVFTYLTLALSILFLLHGQDYMINIGKVGGESLDRVAWEDPNYFGCALGMGTVIALYKLIHSHDDLSFIIKWIYILLIGFSVIVLVRNASRGAILSMAASCAFLVIRTKIKGQWKIVIVIAIAAFVYYLYTSSVMDFLIYRLTNDDGTGGERTIIWKQKIDAFSNSGILHQLFGFGRDEGVGLVNGRSFHNDFLAHLVEYGFIGFVTFVIFFFMPLVNMRGNKILVLAIMVYMFLTCMTIEPLAAGRPVYFAYWLYAYMLSRIPDKCVPLLKEEKK